MGLVAAAVHHASTARQPIARILSVTYDDALRRIRHMLLEAQGYEVISTDGLESSLEQCKLGGFDLFLLGHSIPAQEKHKMVEAFRQVSPAPTSLYAVMQKEGQILRTNNVEPDPEPLLKLIADLVAQKSGAGS